MLPPSIEAPIDDPKRDMPAWQPSGSVSSYSTGWVKRFTRFMPGTYSSSSRS